jgi:hypothetical protein
MQSTSRIPNTIKKPQPKQSDYQVARKQRDITNKLDKEDKKKGRAGRMAKGALNLAGKGLSSVGKTLAQKEPETVGNSQSDDISGGSTYQSRTKRG